MKRTWAHSGCSIGTALACLLGLIEAGQAQSGPFVYVPSNNVSTVSAIDTATDTLGGTFVSGRDPSAAAALGDGSLVYVTNGLDHTVAVVDTRTNTIAATIAVGTTPVGIAVTPDGKTAYVSNAIANNISVINTVTNTVTTTISSGLEPIGIAVSPDGKTAYVANLNSPFVSIINTATNTVSATVNIANAVSVAVSPDGGSVYFGHGNFVSVVNATTNTVTATIGVGSGVLGITVSPDGKSLYAANSSSQSVSVISTATNAVTATISLAGHSPYGVAISPDGKKLYVTNANLQNNVSVINTENNALIATLTVGAVPGFPGICSNGNALLATGLTFRANSSGALSCTLASGPSGAPGPIFTGGTLQFNAGNIASGLPIALMSQGGTLDTNGNNAVLSGVISGSGGLTKVGLGSLILSGQNSYAGPTNVNGGTLEVDGSIASSVLTSINGGATLTGVGTVGDTQIRSGGTFAPGAAGTPGTTMFVSGNLAFQSGAIYFVQLDPAGTTMATVSGAATLGGNVLAAFAPGTYVNRRYDILHAANVSGTFATLDTANLPAGFTATLSYTPTDVLLNLTGALPVTGLNSNQQTVANTLNNFFNSGGALSPGFASVFALTGGNLQAALSKLPGETATGSQQATFNAMSQFVGLLTDPVAGSGGGLNGATSTQAYADGEGEQANAYVARKRIARERDAYAMFTKASLAKVYQPRWSVWASGFGGSQTTDGNAVVGSNTATSRVFGTAVGADYRFSPYTIAGFALAGGGTNFGVANNGTGRSDLFQAGAFVRHNVGAAYVSGALAYGWQDVTTDRTVTIAGVDQLRARFNATVWSGRVEGGYRFVAPFAGGFGITPYAAGQFTTFELPDYAEEALVGSNQFALAYAARSVTDARSELGLRTDKSYALHNAVLTLRGRAAWAHDFNPNRTIGATFQALPGAGFVVNGAAQASESALVTGAAEVKWINGWSVIGTFEGEFSDVARSYAGKGVVRYAW